jgi:hypothetical protein
MPNTSGADYDRNPLVAGGQVEVQTVADPAAGADFSFTLPAGFSYEIRSIAFRLVTGVTVANRTPMHQFTDDQDRVLCMVMPGNTVPASQTVQCNSESGFVSGAQIANTCLTWAIGLRRTRLQPGWKVKSSVAFLQATDQISNVRITLIRRPV